MIGIHNMYIIGSINQPIMISHNHRLNQPIREGGCISILSMKIFLRLIQLVLYYLISIIIFPYLFSGNNCWLQILVTQKPNLAPEWSEKLWLWHKYMNWSLRRQIIWAVVQGYLPHSLLFSPCLLHARNLSQTQILFGNDRDTKMELLSADFPSVHPSVQQ